MGKHKPASFSKGHQRVLDTIKMKQNLKSNTFWDDCNKHYDIATQAIHQVEGQLAEQLSIIVNTPELVGKIEDQQKLTDNLTLLHKDIGEHVERLNSIRENHKDKTGSISNPEEGLEVIQINGKYQEVLEIYNANIVPTICHIFEQIAPAQKAMMDIMDKQKEQIDLIDPTVVSDAVIKGE